VDAVELFLSRHERMWFHIARLTEDLEDAQIRECVRPGVNPLAWILWHIARSEDGAVNLLVAGGREVLDTAWCARMNVPRFDAGTGMTMGEVLALCARVHLPSLMAYGEAVAARSAALVAAIGPGDLDEVVNVETVRDAVARLATGPARAPLDQLWQGTRKGHFLVWLALTHSYEHIGQADLIRGMLGHPDRF
jgi:hypothetical protein